MYNIDNNNNKYTNKITKPEQKHQQTTTIARAIIKT